jgi:hypothetical protein
MTSKSWVCGHSIPGNAGSNLAGDRDLCLLLPGRVSAVGRSPVQTSPKECGVSEGVCVCVIECDQVQQ